MLRELAHEFVEHRLLTYAGAIAFQSLIALVPLTLLGLGLLGATGQARVWRRTIAPALEKRFTHPVYRGIDSTVERILHHGSAGLVVFATLLALWYLAAAVRAIMESLNSIHGVDDGRTWWRRGAISAWLALATGCCLAGASLVVVGAANVGSGGVHVLLGIGRWLVAIVLLGLAIALLVRYAPAEHPQPRWASAGSALVVAVWVGVTELFRWWVGSIANFKSPTGTLTILLVLNGWLFASAMTFLVGVQLDEILRKGSRRRS